MIKFKCNECGKIHEFKDSCMTDVKIEKRINRDLGIENEYCGYFQHYCECRTGIHLEFTFFEYPKKTLNYSDYSQENCVLITEPNYESYFNIKNTMNYNENVKLILEINRVYQEYAHIVTIINCEATISDIKIDLEVDELNYISLEDYEYLNDLLILVKERTKTILDTYRDIYNRFFED